MSDPPRRRPGGRTARNSEAVIQAVQQLVAEGVRDPQVADVAARAGVHPTTIYRRWGSIEKLMLEVEVTRLEDDWPVPATGDLRADLLAYAGRVLASITRPDGLAFLSAAIAATKKSDGEVTGFDLIRRRAARLQGMLDRAGPDASGVTAVDVLDGILAPIYLRVLFGVGETLTPQALERMVDRVVGSAAAADRPKPP